LLYEKNETAYKEKLELNTIAFKQVNPGMPYPGSKDWHFVTDKYWRQKWMILTEGGAFIFLLFLGFIAVRGVFKREMQLVQQQHNFLLSVTHELKSPLSTVKLSLQTLAKRRHELEAEKTEKLLVNSLIDIDRLESLVDNILFAAKIERDEPGFSNDEINVSDITQLAVERFMQNKKAIRIHDHIKTGVYMPTP
jgi:signal transduction histidine kinase